MKEIYSLKELYEHFKARSAEDADHAACLLELARQCPTVLEFGVRNMWSCTYLLQGLTENLHPERSYLGVDLHPPLLALKDTLQLWAEEKGIRFACQECNTLDFLLSSPVDLLHIDSYHTYRHLTYELETFSPQVARAILIHDTHHPYGMMDEDTNPEEDQQIYRLNLLNETRYPAFIDRTKRGLWAAVEDFLRHHPEWELKKRSLIGTGLTVLGRSKQLRAQ